METSLPVVDCCPLCSDLDSFIVDWFSLSIRYRRSLYHSIYWFVARHPFAEGDSLGRPVLRDLHLGLARSAERDPGARLSHNMVSKPIYFYTYYCAYSRFILAIRGRPCVEPEKATPLDGLGCLIVEAVLQTLCRSGIFSSNYLKKPFLSRKALLMQLEHQFLSLLPR